MTRRKPPKYRATPTTVDGITFASRKEARRYAELKLLERAGHVAGLALQRPYRLEVNGQLIATYVADFVYRDVRRGGREVVEDVKGFRTPVYKLKRKLMLALHGVRILET